MICEDMGRQASLLRVTGAVLALAFAVAVPALAASTKPDTHDRALVRQLDRKVSAFRAIAGKGGSNETTTLDSCPYLKKHPKQAFAAAFALLPALLAELVNTYKPEIVGLQSTLTSLHPDSPLFTQWLSAMNDDFSLILSFDNHGKKIDLCHAAVVMLDKKSTAADIKRVTGLDPGLFSTLFTSPVTAKLTKLNSQMDTFFIQAGLSAKDAGTLTSND